MHKGLYLRVLLAGIVCLSTIILVSHTPTKPVSLWWSFTTQAPVSGHMAYSMPKRSPFTFYGNYMYVSDYHGHVYALDTTTHNLIWTFTTNNYSPYPVTTTGTHVFVSDFDGRVYALDAKTGRERWRYRLPENIIPDTPIILAGPNALVGGRDGVLYALSQTTGALVWTFRVGTPALSVMSLPPQIIHFGMLEAYGDHILINTPYGNIYTLSTTGQVIKKTSQSTYKQQNPSIILGLSTLPTSPLALTNELIATMAADIDISTITHHGNTIYFLSRDNMTFFGVEATNSSQYKKVLLTCCSKQKPLIPITRWYQSQKTLSITFLKEATLFFQKIQNTKIDMSLQKIPNTTPESYEIIVKHDDSPYSNPWIDVSMQTVFIDERNQKYTIPGFYKDKNIWSVRFAPPHAGVWHYVTRFNTGVFILQRRGTFSMRENDDKKRFLTINPNTPFGFSFEDKTAFMPVGVQDVVWDHNFDGNPLNQWGSPQNSPLPTAVRSFVSLDEYLAFYAAGGEGINLYRLNIDNASYRLWHTISPSGNRYNLRAGDWTDELVLALQKHSMRIWFSLFGIDPPFAKTKLQPNQKIALQHYLDYVVGRFGAFVDIWEVANETHVSEEWLTFVTGYIASIDPYHHPITTNWETPDHANINITSLHWYDDTTPQTVDSTTDTYLTHAQKYKKPLVISEQGNKKTSWDPTSALRLRAKLWISYMHGTSLIFWNQVWKYYENPDNANIFIGTTELAYIKHFRALTRNTKQNESTQITATPHEGVHIYWPTQRKEKIGYIYHEENQYQPTQITLTITTDYKNILTWFNPENGLTVKTEYIQPGTTHITTPIFYKDLVVKIEKEQ